ncbi:MBL fold metallo-hydrolase [Halobellus sp. GM3]|uniref:MBL fold metallo-hydrolase n=1 Tax=Halobellus sp. GM3 TaxID=3458410 RepID=UPI00403D652C
MDSKPIRSLDLLRPQNPDEARPQTNEPVTVHILDGEETVLFGTGFDSGLETLTAALDAYGGPDVIVVEHGDPDHYAALPSLLERYDATVAIPSQDAQALEGIGVTPDVKLGHDEHHWGVRTVHVPGHTPGNMSFLHEPSDTLIVGDTFVHRNSFAAAPGEWSGRFAPIKPELNADDRQARENIATLRGYPFDTAVTTHGLNVFEGAAADLEALLADLNLA